MLLTQYPPLPGFEGLHPFHGVPVGTPFLLIPLLPPPLGTDRLGQTVLFPEPPLLTEPVLLPVSTFYVTMSNHPTVFSFTTICGDLLYF